MSGLLPDAAGTKSAWNTENHYFYEVLNRTGKSVFILLALSSKEMPKDQIEISDKINIHFPTKGDKPGWGYRVPFKTKTYEIKDINDKGAVFDRLDECLKEIKGFEDELLKKVL